MHAGNGCSGAPEYAPKGHLTLRVVLLPNELARRPRHYNRIPRHTLKTLEAWIATGRHLDVDGEAEAFCLAIVMNDLAAAVAHPDEAHLAALRQILTGCSIMRRGAATEARPR